jgi:hypothetical protein
MSPVGAQVFEFTWSVEAASARVLNAIADTATAATEVSRRMILEPPSSIP